MRALPSRLSSTPGSQPSTANPVNALMVKTCVAETEGFTRRSVGWARNVLTAMESHSRHGNRATSAFVLTP